MRVFQIDANSDRESKALGRELGCLITSFGRAESTHATIETITAMGVTK
jgi:hypothetical protein